MSSRSRIGAIDILKGLIIISIIFINVLFLKNHPLWPGNQETPTIAAILAGILFPALIFLTGMTIPFSITKKINEGLSGFDIIRDIFARSIILIAVGVMMVNTKRVEPQLTGFSEYIWAILLFIAIFLVWNRYPDKENNFFATSGLRLLGLAILAFLIFKFKSGTFENNGSLIPGWWEFPGLAGWGYLVASLIFLVFRNSFTGTFILWVIFLVLNILSGYNMAPSLDSIKPYFGVIIDGYIPLIILSGQLVSLILRRFASTEIKRTILIIACIGVVLTVSGIFLYRYIFPTNIYGNPSWAMISCGLTSLLFVVIFWLDEKLKVMNWSITIRYTGENMFMAYIIHNLLLNLAWLSGIDIFFFLKSGSVALVYAGAVIWAMLVFGVTTLLLRINIRLKF